MKIVRLPVLPPGVVRLADPPGIVVEGPRHPRSGNADPVLARFGGWVHSTRGGEEVVRGKVELVVTPARLAMVVFDGSSDGGTLRAGESMAVLSLAFDDVTSARATADGLELTHSGGGSVTVVDVHERLKENLTLAEAADTPMLLREIRRARSGAIDPPRAEPQPPPQRQVPDRLPSAQPIPLRARNPRTFTVDDIRRSVTESAIPPPVWAVIGLLCVAGGFIIIPLLRALPDVLSGGGSSVLAGFRFLILVVFLLGGAIGAACFGLAFLLWRADRVGRVLTVALCAAIVVGFLLGNDRSTADVLVVLAAIGAIAALVGSTSARQYFTGPQAYERDQPSSVVAARTILIADAAMLSVAGGLLLLAGGLGGKFVLIGLGLLGVSAGGFWANGQLRLADTRARLIVSALMGGYAVLLLMVGEPDAGILAAVGVAAAVPVLLWLGPDAREYFGDRPLDYGDVLGQFQQQGRPNPDEAR